MAVFTLLTSGSSAAGAARTRAAGAATARAGTGAIAAVLGSWRGGRTSATVPRGSKRADTAVRLVVMDRPSGQAEAAARVTACDTTPHLLHSRLSPQRQQGRTRDARAGTSNCQMLWTAAASGGFGLLHPIDKPNPGDDLRQQR